MNFLDQKKYSSKCQSDISAQKLPLKIIRVGWQHEPNLPTVCLQKSSMFDNLLLSRCRRDATYFLQPFLNPHKDAQNVTKLRKSLIKIKFPSRVFYWHLVQIELTTGCHAVFSQSQLPGFLISCLVFQVKGCHISRTCDEFTQAILV